MAPRGRGSVNLEWVLKTTLIKTCCRTSPPLPCVWPSGVRSCYHSLRNEHGVIGLKRPVADALPKLFLGARLKRALEQFASQSASRNWACLGNPQSPQVHCPRPTHHGLVARGPRHPPCTPVLSRHPCECASCQRSGNRSARPRNCSCWPAASHRWIIASLVQRSRGRSWHRPA